MHHAKIRYGTVEDPEYLPLALMKPWTLPVFVVAALLGAGRAAVPLRRAGAAVAAHPAAAHSWSSSAFRGCRSTRCSAASRAEGEFARALGAGMEGAASLWAIALIAMVATGIVPLRAFLIFLGVASGVMLLNQVRTLVAHLWENDGEPMSVTEQYLDRSTCRRRASGPSCGRRSACAITRCTICLPGMPYHALGEAHRRLSDRAGGGFGLSRRQSPRAVGRWSAGSRSARWRGGTSADHSSDRISTLSPISRNRKNGAQAASRAGRRRHCPARG